MKEIAFNIEAQVAFKYNEINEKRMAPELLDAVHSRISKKGNELKDKANIQKLKGMQCSSVISRLMTMSSLKTLRT